ncbi:hypothetical protein [Niveispirillum fermenti]|uniref:hypothetical protein n=1 Tax=Niveispirillum fermenti TaxID=1233113 RepID=UPI003A86BC64
MVLYTPPLPPLQQPVTPPSRDRQVTGVTRIEPRQRREEGGGGRRSLRHRLIDLVMEEVEGLPDLSTPQKQRIRHSLDRFADRPAMVPPPTDEPAQPSPSPPPPPTSEQVVEMVAGLADDGPDPPDTPDADPDLAREEARQLAAQMRSLLALHTEEATKIATYVQALMNNVGPEAHQVDLDI